MTINEMKVGDLVKISSEACEQLTNGGEMCGCWFCFNDSNGLGVVFKRLDGANVDLGVGGYWSVMFDVGEWRLYGTEMEIVGECG